MGGPMALNLINAGYHLSVFDLTLSATTQVAEQGARVATSAADVVSGADVVISMLPASDHVEDLYAGLLDSIDPKTIIIDCSTIAPEAALKVHAAAEARQLQMLDAPVSGGTAGAKAGTLTFMVGGAPELVQQCNALFTVMGANCFHAGRAGAGQVAKICNNMLLAISMVGTAEVLELGVASGLDATVLSKIMSQSSGNNWSLSVYNPYPGVSAGVPAENDYQGGFAVDLMLKDLGLAMAAGAKAGSQTPMGNLAQAMYMALKRQLNTGTQDFSSIQKLYSKAVGTLK